MKSGTEGRTCFRGAFLVSETWRARRVPAGRANEEEPAQMSHHASKATLTGSTSESAPGLQTCCTSSRSQRGQARRAAPARQISSRAASRCPSPRTPQTRYLGHIRLMTCPERSRKVQGDAKKWVEREPFSRQKWRRGF